MYSLDTCTIEEALKGTFVSLPSGVVVLSELDFDFDFDFGWLSVVVVNSRPIPRALATLSINPATDISKTKSFKKKKGTYSKFQ